MTGDVSGCINTSVFSLHRLKIRTCVLAWALALGRLMPIP